MPSTRAYTSRSSSFRNSGVACVMAIRTRPSSRRERSTGSTPTFSSWVTRRDPSSSSMSPSSTSACIVAMVGCPASGISFRGVKNRTRKSATAEGVANAVSLRFSSRAIACICSAESPSARVITPQGLPAYRSVVKESTIVISYSGIAAA